MMKIAIEELHDPVFDFNFNDAGTLKQTKKTNQKNWWIVQKKVGIKGKEKKTAKMLLQRPKPGKSGKIPFLLKFLNNNKKTKTTQNTNKKKQKNKSF